MIGKVQTQLHKNKQGSKDKQESEDEQKGKETSVEEAHETKDKQRGKEIGVKEANESDKPNKLNNKLYELSESSGSDYLFVLIV